MANDDSAAPEVIAQGLVQVILANLAAGGPG